MNETTQPKKRGVKQGTKNALKHANSRHSETQQVTYTPDQWQGVKADMKAAGVSAHTHYARQAVVNYRKSQSTIFAAKELVILLGTIGIDFENHQQYSEYSDCVEIIRTYSDYFVFKEEVKK